MMRVDILEGQSEEEEEESGRERTRVGETRGWTCRGSEVVRYCEWAAGTV